MESESKEQQLISDKAEFKLKFIRRGKESHYTLAKGTSPRENITNVNTIHGYQTSVT